MKGKILYGQLGLLLLVGLLFGIAYGGGVWWSLEMSGLELSMTLWKICSVYGDNEVCNPIASHILGEGKQEFYEKQFIIQFCPRCLI